MEQLYNVCIGITVGVIAGFIAGGIKFKFGKKQYSEEKIQKTRRFIGKAATGLKYITFLLLVTGFIWCVYFLVLGIVRPEQADYANNIAELIVAVLTVISIIFAFVEFLRHKNDKTDS